MLYAYEWLETICSIKSTAGFCDHKVADQWQMIPLETNSPAADTMLGLKLDIIT